MDIRRMLCKMVLGILTAGTVFTGAPMGVDANDTPAQKNESEDFFLEELVVTATKTGETELRKTPIAVTALAGEMLRDTGVFRLRELGEFVPNVEFTHNIGDTQGFIRGVGNYLMGIQAAGTNVAFYVDGVYIEAGAGLTTDFFDVERIEILRGPQGTLYGRNANSGAVNIITRKPSDTFEFDAALELGNFNLRRVDATVSGPVIGDIVKARVTVSDSERDGVLDNISTGNDPRSKDFTGVRGSVEIAPTDAFDLLIAADYTDFDSSGASYKLNTDQGMFGTALGAEVAPGFWDVNTDTPGWLKRENSGISGTVNYHPNQQDNLRLITAYREYESESLSDIDGSQMPLSIVGGTYDNRQFSQEVQYQMSRGNWLWLLGGFYYHQESSSSSEGELNYILLTYVNSLNTETDSYALFSSIKYDLNSLFSVEAGLRYTTDDKDMRVKSVAESPIIQIPPSDVKYSDDWSEFLPRFVFNYNPTRDMMFYLSAAKGYRPGGFAPFNIVADSYINPEYIWSYELGYKASWFNNRLQTNTAIFYSDYKDLEVLYVTMGVGQQDNAAEATIQGVELEFTARPMAALTLNGMVAYLDATYDEYMTQEPGSTPAVPLDVSGNSLPYAPRWSASLGAQYVFSLGSYGRLTLRGDMSWKDRVYFDQYERDSVSQSSYTLFNGLLRYETVAGRWSVEVYGTNLFEEEYLTYSHVLSEPLDVNWVQGDPRLYGIRIGYRY